MSKYDLERFVAAQQGCYESVRQELSAGHKNSHWMWFIFPQMRGLGQSETSRYYGISGRLEAQSYLAHPVLGARLNECVTLVLAHAALPPSAIFGAVDAMKFLSSMTLYEAASGSSSVFKEAIELFYHGQRDERTLKLLGSAA